MAGWPGIWQAELKYGEAKMKSKHTMNFGLWIFAAATIVSSFTIAPAQSAETFDIATFRIPKGWSKEVSESSFQVSTQNKTTGTFCLITVYRSVPGTSDSKENFELACKSIGKETADVSAR